MSILKLLPLTYHVPKNINPQSTRNESVVINNYRTRAQIFAKKLDLSTQKF